MPIETELRSVSPAQKLSPACQARIRLADHLGDAAVLIDQVMAGDLGFRRAANPRPSALSMPV